MRVPFEVPGKLLVAQISSELIHARRFQRGEILEFAPLRLQQLLGFRERRRRILKRLPPCACRVVGPDRVLAGFGNRLGDFPTRLPELRASGQCGNQDSDGQKRGESAGRHDCDGKEDALCREHPLLPALRSYLGTLGSGTH